MATEHHLPARHETKLNKRKCLDIGDLLSLASLESSLALWEFPWKLIVIMTNFALFQTNDAVGDHWNWAYFVPLIVIGKIISHFKLFCKFQFDVFRFIFHAQSCSWCVEWVSEELAKTSEQNKKNLEQEFLEIERWNCD